jgi:hypothetical protein
MSWQPPAKPVSGSFRTIYNGQPHRFLASGKTQITGVLLPIHDFTLNPQEPGFPSSYRAYRDNASIDAQGHPALRPIGAFLRVHKNIGKREDDFVSPLSLANLFQDGVQRSTDDPIVDIVNTIKDEKHHWHRLSQEGSAPGGRRLIQFPGQTVVMNVYATSSKNPNEQAKVGLMTISASGVTDYDTQMNTTRPAMIQQPRDPEWPNYLYGDVTHPNHPVVFNTMTRTNPSNSSQTYLGFFFSNNSLSYDGLRPGPVISEQLLAQRINIFDPNLYNFLVYQELVDMLVADQVYPLDLIQEACGGRANILGTPALGIPNPLPQQQPAQQWGAPQQQPAAQQWGAPPQQQQPAQGAWGAPQQVAQQPAAQQWGAPQQVAQQPAAQQWGAPQGQPAAQQWGAPAQQPAAQGWGPPTTGAPAQQPAQQWGAPQGQPAAQQWGAPPQQPAQQPAAQGWGQQPAATGFQTDSWGGAGAAAAPSLTNELAQQPVQQQPPAEPLLWVIEQGQAPRQVPKGQAAAIALLHPGQVGVCTTGPEGPFVSPESIGLIEPPKGNPAWQQQPAPAQQPAPQQNWGAPQQQPAPQQQWGAPQQQPPAQQPQQNWGAPQPQQPEQDQGPWGAPAAGQQPTQQQQPAEQVPVSQGPPAVDNSVYEQEYAGKSPAELMQESHQLSSKLVNGGAAQVPDAIPRLAWLNAHAG